MKRSTVLLFFISLLLLSVPACSPAGTSEPVGEGTPTAEPKTRSHPYANACSYSGRYAHVGTQTHSHASAVHTNGRSARPADRSGVPGRVQTAGP